MAHDQIRGICFIVVLGLEILYQLEIVLLLYVSNWSLVASQNTLPRHTVKPSLITADRGNRDRIPLQTWRFDTKAGTILDSKVVRSPKTVLKIPFSLLPKVCRQAVITRMSPTDRKDTLLKNLLKFTHVGLVTPEDGGVNKDIFASCKYCCGLDKLILALIVSSLSRIHTPLCWHFPIILVTLLIFVASPERFSHVRNWCGVLACGDA